MNNLLSLQNVVTKYPIVSMSISYDSAAAISVTKRNDFEYYVKMYCLDTKNLIFEEKIGGDSSQYIKMKEVEQNAGGNKYCVSYIDDGKFRVRVFDRIKPSRSEDEITASEIDVN